MKDKITIARRNAKVFHPRSGRCPICKRVFRWDNCPHSVAEAEEYLEEQIIRAIVRDEMAKSYVRTL